MAKHTKFEVSINGSVKAVKFAFNAARRVIPNLVREYGSLGDVWVLQSEQQEFYEGGLNRCGTVMVWENEKTNERITCKVEAR